MEERGHIIKILEDAKKALIEQDTLKLGELSNQTIHSASAFQDIGSISIAVVIYTLGKIVERKEHIRMKNWDRFTKKINSIFSLALKALKEEKDEKYEDYMKMARKAIISVSPNIKRYIEEVLRKASINKGSKIYEHGISMGQTAKILGLTKWELSEYTGQTKISDIKYNLSLETQKRAKTAMEFFS